MRRSLILILLALPVIIVVALLASGQGKPEAIVPLEVELGTSFSPAYAESLGLNPREAFGAILDEFKFHYVRLPLYWDRAEPENGQFDFSELEWYLQEAARRGVSVVLSLGYRNFRYPECYPPDWVNNLDNTKFEEELLELLAVATSRFAGGSYGQAVEAWQVENEPFDLPLFRRWCRRLPSDLLEREIEVVRANDPFQRPIILTFGGEILFRSLWRGTMEKADIIGVSFYPRATFPLGGPLVQTYRLGILSPRNIIKERQFAENLGKEFWVVEMQAEPWRDVPESMSPELLKENYDLLLSFGGARRIYFWGAEWWYAEKLSGHGEIWVAAKELIAP